MESSHSKYVQAQKTCVLIRKKGYIFATKERNKYRQFDVDSFVKNQI